MKKRKKILSIIGIGFAVIIVIGLATGGGSDTPETSSTKPVQVSEENQRESETTMATVPVQENDSLDFTPLELYQALQDNEVIPYTLNEKATQFLSEHKDLFPLAETDSEKLTEDLIDYSIEMRHIEKNAGKYGDKLMVVAPVEVIQIQEESLTETQYFSELNVVDMEGQQYYVLYIGELDDIFTGDIVNVVGLPLGYSHFDNTDGGQTFVVLLAGCQVTSE